MKTEPIVTFCAGATLSTLVMTAACLYDSHEAKTKWRDQIVKHHGAEYYLDQNHERQWRWLDEKPSIEVRP